MRLLSSTFSIIILVVNTLSANAQNSRFYNTGSQGMNTPGFNDPTPKIPEPKLFEPKWNNPPSTSPSQQMTFQEEFQEKIRKQNEEIRRRSGNHPPTQEEIRLSANNEMYGKSPELSEEQRRFLEVQRQVSILNEVSATEYYLQQRHFYQSAHYKSSLPMYEQSYQGLKDMLDGKRPLSLKDGYYMMEAPFGGLHLTYNDYSQLIDQSATFILQMIEEEGLSANDQEALHWGIQRFLGDTVRLTVKQSDLGQLDFPKTHLPFFYDYVDYRARDDFRNYFVTKTLATGTGQCNTLPAVYLLLAEAIGVKAYLSYAPRHSFIKYKNNKGQIVNYETTVNWHFTDQDYVKELPVMVSAIQNRIYLDTLNKRQIIAGLMIDLGHSFKRRNWVSDGAFIRKCVRTGSKAMGEGRSNRTALTLESDLYAAEFDRLFQKEGLENLEDMQYHPEVLEAFRRFQMQEETMRQLGYQDFPEAKYVEMLEKHDRRGRLQMAKQIDTKSKKDLFIYN